MIQRIQSVYLFFVFCLMAMLAFIPFSSSWMVTIEAGIIAVFSVITIFLYKNRSLQIKMSYLLLLLLILVYALYFIFNWKPQPIAEFFRQIGYSFVFPLIAIVLVYLAIRGIRKDEKLIRSLDRLR